MPLLNTMTDMAFIIHVFIEKVGKKHTESMPTNTYDFILHMTESYPRANVGSESSKCFSGAFTGSIRSQSPSTSSQLGSEWVTWRYLSTSPIGVSNFPEISLSNKILRICIGWL